MSDQVFYENIGRILVGSGPELAREIIVRARIFAEGNGGEYEFDYIDPDGKLNWFSPAGRAVRDLTEELVRMRSFYAANNMAGKDGHWNRCEIKLNLDENKLFISFSYDE
ncbi:hypothetical protein [Pseudomonas oryzihabitans]|uniref:hypothetical protein n=1 Tax=Pseudomonas oryzihabitans TaxID=47885 RepID=UPI00123A3E60|nr:hypothetical protein [Pseudomonas oryzihabitans]QEU05350.1 hypothetical protein FOB65_19265 [Pseudomonas oryzihabitans]